MHRNHSIPFLLIGLCLLASEIRAGRGPLGGGRLDPRADRDGGLSGWKSFSEKPGLKTGNVWKLAADGVLVCKGTPKGYIYTEKSYANFVLKLHGAPRPARSPATAACSSA